ncbi:MAG: glycosyltransferase family 39 protein [Sphingobium sp.]
MGTIGSKGAMAGTALPRGAATPGLIAELVAPLCWTAIGVGIACRLFAGIDAPLWFDETFSAAIASQDGAGAVRWMLHELSGPVYYSMLFLWQHIAGDGNAVLRLPSLLFSIATPLLILWKGHPDRQVRMVWAALIALSIMAFDTATQARPYALLLLLVAAQAIAFLRLIDRPTRAQALAWTSLSALAVLTHYHAAILCGIQGVAYLAICRERALRTWPALAPLLPMAAWMAVHIPFHLSYASKDTVWYDVLGPGALWLVPSLIAGLPWVGAVLIGGLGVSFGYDLAQTLRGRSRWPYSAGATALAASGWLALALVMGMGFVAPSFSVRYVLPFVPALLAGIALWVRRMGTQGPLIAAPLLAVMIAAAATQLIGYIRDPQADFRYAYNLEQPSAWIAARGAERLIFFWDNPAAALPDPDGNMAKIGGYFFARAGRPVAVVVPPWRRGDDPNRLLPALAGEEPGTAILWAYDAGVRGTLGRDHPWAIARHDPSWLCRDFGRRPITVLACVKRERHG